MLDLLITHATLPDGRQNMSIAVQNGRIGGADKNLDWFYAASPRLTRYSIGLRAPREILIRFSLYQRM